MRKSVMVLGVLAVCATTHCGSDDSKGSGGSGPGGNGGASGEAGTGGASDEAGTGGTAGVSGSGGDSGAAGGTQDGYTSLACGAIPILGPQTPSIDEACTTCVDESCCTEAKACGDDAECKAFRVCLEGCAGAVECADQCYVDHAEGEDPSVVFSTCRNTKCGTVCASLACVGTVTWDEPSEDTYDLTLIAYELQSGSYLEGLTVRACAVDDAACAAPLGEASTDAQGAVTLTVPSAVEGLGAYFEITGATVTPTLAYLNFTDNITGFEQGTFYTPVMSTGTTDLLTGVMQVTLDPGRGHVLFQARDCGNYSLPGVSVAVDVADAESTTAYINGSLPSTTATVTDPSGRGAVVNVPPGAATVTGAIEPTGTVYSAFDVLVRAGFMTTVNVVPTPEQ